MTKFNIKHIIIGIVIYLVLIQLGFIIPLFSSVSTFAVDDIRNLKCDPNSKNLPSCYDKGGLGTIKCSFDSVAKEYRFDTTYCVDTQPVKDWVKKNPIEFIRTHILFSLGVIIFLAVMLWVFSEDGRTKPSIFDKIKKFFEGN